MPQRNVATNFTFEQQRAEINLLAQDFWSQKGTVDTASSTYLKHDGSNNFTGQTLAVPNAFTINSNSGNGTVTIAGNLQVDGTTTTVNTATMDVVDKNITIAKGSANDAAADGAGLTVDSGDGDKTFNFVDANDAWVSSIGVESTTFLKATTFLEAARGQFTGATSPTAGSGVEVNAPDANTGQIIAYNRGTTTYNELRVKGTSVGLYTGSTNALVGTFNSTGLTMESGKTITGNVTGDLTGSVLTAAQTNITSVGTLTSLDVSGNVDINSSPWTVTGGNFRSLSISGSDNASSGFLWLGNGAATANADFDLGRINFVNNTTITSQIAGSTQTSANDDGRLSFHTKSAGGSNNLTERLRIGSDGTVSKYHNATDVAAAFGGAGQVNGVTGLPAMAGTPFVVAKDTGSGRSATFAGLVENQGAVTIRGYVGIGADSYTGYTFPTPTGIQNNVKLLQIDGGDGAELILGNSLSPNVSTNHVGAIAFKNIDDSYSAAPNYAGIRCNCTDTGGNMNLKFYAGSTRFEADTPDMIIDAFGKVGVGVADPAVAGSYHGMEIGGHNNSGLRISTTHAGGWAFTDYEINGTQAYIAGVKGGTDSLSSASSWRICTGASLDSNIKLVVNANGSILPGSDNTQDLGSTSYRWANLYTGDINLCNEGSYNEVDGTSGSWTMQEGDSDLFLINRKSGKKYKFNLTEVA